MATCNCFTPVSAMTRSSKQLSVKFNPALGRLLARFIAQEEMLQDLVTGMIL